MLQNTSVLSPIITMAIMALPTYFYAYHSNFVYRHSVIFFTALSLPMCKAVMYIVVSRASALCMVVAVCVLLLVLGHKCDYTCHQ